MTDEEKKIEEINSVPHEVDEKTWALIDKIANRLAHKFTFGYYDVEDICQQARIFGLQGLKRYKTDKGPLENFLCVHINNRLKNFKRDNYFRADQPKNKKNIERWEKRTKLKINLLEPISINMLPDNFTILEDHIETLNFEDLIVTINKRLPSRLRTDFLRMYANVRIPRARREQVQEAIEDILEELSDAKRIAQDAS